jgi:hypothetical protein
VLARKSALRVACADPARIESTKLASQPRGVAVSSDGSVTAVACQKEVCVLRSGGRVLVHRMDAECMCIDMHPNGRTVAVGCMVGVHTRAHVHILCVGQQSAHLTTRRRRLYTT